MRKCVSWMAILLMVLGTVGCASRLRLVKSDVSAVNDVDGIYMEVDQKAIREGTEGITATIVNDTDNILSFGVDYAIEKREKNGWMRVEYKKDVAWIEIAQIMKGKERCGFPVDFSLFPPLPAGEYRVIKRIQFTQSETAEQQHETVIAAEFAVEE